MNDDPGDARVRPVPSGRAERFGQFGRLAAGVAGGMIAEGARRSGRIVAACLRVDAGSNAGHLPRMSTLAEIESAAATLSPPEKAELLLFVAGQLRATGASLPEPRLFSPEQLAAWMDEDEEDMRKFRAAE